MPAELTKPAKHSRILALELAERFGRMSELHGVEVGVWRGDNAHFLLGQLPNLYLYLVDPYVAYDDADETEKPDGELKQQRLMDIAKQVATSKHKEFKDRRAFYFMSGSDLAKAIRLFYDAPFDFVFIDAHHAYESVKQDITVWWPLIKPGGVLCGHDYKRHRTRGVKKAVDEFAAREPIELKLPGAAIWWIEKP